jgi:hypothetical protein
MISHALCAVPFEFVINLKIAKALSLKIHSQLLARADGGDRDKARCPLDSSPSNAKALVLTRTGPTRVGKLFRSLAHVPFPDLRLVVQNDVQQRATDFKLTVVFDIAQFAELIHEKAHARSRRADHFRKGLLTKLPDDRLSRGFFAEIRQST